MERSERYKIVDNDLGELVYQHYETSGSFSCSKRLAISSEKIDVFFDAESKETTPTFEQKLFYNEILKHYDKITSQLYSFLPQELKISKYQETQNIRQCFQPVAFNIPAVDSNNFSWDMTFKIMESKNGFLIVYLERLEVKSAYLEKDNAKPWVRFFMRLFGQY